MKHEERLNDLIGFYETGSNTYIINQLKILKEEIKYDLLKERVDQTSKISQLFKTK